MIYKMSSFDFCTSILTSLKVILQTKIELFVTSKSPIIYHNNFVKKQKKNQKKQINMLSLRIHGLTLK